MSPECGICGYPALRRGGHAEWCERTAAWLRTAAWRRQPATVLDVRHGSLTGYSGGCRCDACRGAAREYGRGYRPRLRAAS